jgi:hypothetical protein
VLAKQYTIKLPADYDMEIIRDRVRSGGPKFDLVKGLAFKAFLITERSRGATANRYSPFYVWHDTPAANAFLYGDGFAGLEASFGRPRIEHWIGLDVAIGSDGPARSATREDVVIRDRESLADVRHRELEWLHTRGEDPRGLHVAAVALDPQRWTMVRFAAWNTPAGAQTSRGPGTAYEVLHLSLPDRDALGRVDLEAKAALARPRG